MLDVLWPDAELESMTMRYETLELAIQETTGATTVITCHGPIGCQVTGFWDEVVISEAQVVEDHPYGELC